jgi:predicted aspartyl protease
MIHGSFDDNTPLVGIAVGWGQGVQFPFVILDTGFTGDLQVTPQMARDLNLKVSGVTKTRIASGEVRDVPTGLAVASMEGMAKTINVLISDSDPLIGISFLSKFSYKAIVNCKHKTVVLERV